jgi:hypothetical protein
VEWNNPIWKKCSEIIDNYAKECGDKKVKNLRQAQVIRFRVTAYAAGFINQGPTFHDLGSYTIHLMKVRFREIKIWLLLFLAFLAPTILRRVYNNEII